MVAGSYPRLSNSPYTNKYGRKEHQQSMVYQAPSGAWVFDAGSIWWSWGLYNDSVHKFADARIQRMTTNFLSRISAGA